jgi:hypothetical protein
VQPIQLRRPTRHIDIRHTLPNEPIIDPSLQLSAVAVLARQAIPASASNTKSDRSVPIEAFDRASATIQMLYFGKLQYGPRIGGVLSGTDQQSIADLSDRYWHRYGSYNISGAALAQLEEVCAVSGPGQAVDMPAVSTHDVLKIPFVGCEPRSVNASEASERLPTACVVVSPHDVVTPKDLAVAKLRDVADDVRWVDSDDDAHGSLDGLEACMKFVHAS